jgi:hypothetical protein
VLSAPPHIVIELLSRYTPYEFADVSLYHEKKTAFPAAIVNVLAHIPKEIGSAVNGGDATLRRDVEKVADIRQTQHRQ